VLTSYAQVSQTALSPPLLRNSLSQNSFVVGGKQQIISSLTFVFRSSSCGVLPALNASRVQSFWYDAGDDATSVSTIERYHKVGGDAVYIIELQGRYVLFTVMQQQGYTKRKSLRQQYRAVGV
jgi:hypothetical protein